jgi:hypothetical protein
MSDPRQRMAEMMMGQQDPRADFMRSEHDMSRMKEPYRNTPAGVSYEGLGSALGIPASIYGMIQGARGGGSSPMGAAIGAGTGLWLGATAGQVGGHFGQGLDRLGLRRPMQGLSPNAGQRHMDTDGSEERIGQGMSGPQNPQGPRYSRPPNIYGN